MLIHMTTASLIGSFIFGMIGLFIFMVGRKRVNYPWVVLGLVLMVFPGIVQGTTLWVAGTVLTLVAVYFRNAW